MRVKEFVISMGAPVAQVAETTWQAIRVTEVVIHIIAASAGTGGSISPAGNVIVNEGESKTFNITPYSGYEIRDILVDGISVGAVSSYSFWNVSSDHTIHASFEPITPPDGDGPPPPDGEGFPWWAGGLIGAGLIAIAAIARRREK